MPNVPYKLHVPFVVCLAAGASLLAGCDKGSAEKLETVARSGSLQDGSLVGEVQYFAGRELDGKEINFAAIVGEQHEMTEIVVPEGVELERGSMVRAYGDRDADGRLVMDDFTLLAGPPQHVIDPERREARRLATILVFWNEAGLQNATAADQMYTGDRSTNVFYGENSYGMETLAGEVFGPYEIPDPGGCNTGTIANSAIVALNEHGHDDTEYRQLMFHFPSGIGCSFSGLASVGSPLNPARFSWYNGSFGCVVRNQEIGHNYGMAHSRSYDSCESNPNNNSCEYGDQYDPMGGGCGHVNVVQKGYMGWFDGCNVVDTDVSGLYNISATELPCNGTQALRMPTPEGRYVYLEYRQRIGGFDGPSGIDGVIAHVAGEFSGGSPTPYLFESPGDNGRMHVGDEFTDPGSTMTITIVEENETYAVVDVQFVEEGTDGPSCTIGDGVPEDAAGAVGSIECADETYPGDTEPPEVEIVFPADGQVFAPGSDFTLQAEVTDDRYIFELELYVDGEPLFKIQEEPWEWGVYAIPEGTYEFGIVARDARNWAPSNTVTIQVRDEVPSDTDTDSDGGEETGDDTTPGTTGGVDPSTSGPGTTGVDEDESDGDTEEDDTAGADDDSGCSCTQGRGMGGGAPASMLMLMGLVWMRRRRPGQRG